MSATNYQFDIDGTNSANFEQSLNGTLSYGKAWVSPSGYFYKKDFSVTVIQDGTPRELTTGDYFFGVSNNEAMGIVNEEPYSYIVITGNTDGITGLILNVRFMGQYEDTFLLNDLQKNAPTTIAEWLNYKHPLYDGNVDDSGIINALKDIERAVDDLSSPDPDLLDVVSTPTALETGDYFSIYMMPQADSYADANSTIRTQKDQAEEPVSVIPNVSPLKDLRENNSKISLSADTKMGNSNGVNEIGIFNTSSDIAMTLDNTNIEGLPDGPVLASSLGATVITAFSLKQLTQKRSIVKLPIFGFFSKNLDVYLDTLSKRLYYKDSVSNEVFTQSIFGDFRLAGQVLIFEIYISPVSSNLRDVTITLNTFDSGATTQTTPINLTSIASTNIRLDTMTVPRSTPDLAVSMQGLIMFDGQPSPVYKELLRRYYKQVFDFDIEKNKTGYFDAYQQYPLVDVSSASSEFKYLQLVTSLDQHNLVLDPSIIDGSMKTINDTKPNTIDSLQNIDNVYKSHAEFTGFSLDVDLPSRRTKVIDSKRTMSLANLDSNDNMIKTTTILNGATSYVDRSEGNFTQSYIDGEPISNPSNDLLRYEYLSANKWFVGFSLAIENIFDTGSNANIFVDICGIAFYIRRINSELSVTLFRYDSPTTPINEYGESITSPADIVDGINLFEISKGDNGVFFKVNGIEIFNGVINGPNGYYYSRRGGSKCSIEVYTGAAQLSVSNSWVGLNNLFVGNGEPKPDYANQWAKYSVGTGVNPYVILKPPVNFISGISDNRMFGNRNRDVDYENNGVVVKNIGEEIDTIKNTSKTRFVTTFDDIKIIKGLPGQSLPQFKEVVIDSYELSSNNLGCVEFNSEQGQFNVNSNYTLRTNVTLQEEKKYRTLLTSFYMDTPHTQAELNRYYIKPYLGVNLTLTFNPEEVIISNGINEQRIKFEGKFCVLGLVIDYYNATQPNNDECGTVYFNGKLLDVKPRANSHKISGAFEQDLTEIKAKKFQLFDYYFIDETYDLMPNGNLSTIYQDTINSVNAMEYIEYSIKANTNCFSDENGATPTIGIDAANIGSANSSNFVKSIKTSGYGIERHKYTLGNKFNKLKHTSTEADVIKNAVLMNPSASTQNEYSFFMDATTGVSFVEDLGINTIPRAWSTYALINIDIRSITDPRPIFISGYPTVTIAAMNPSTESYKKISLYINNGSMNKTLTFNVAKGIVTYEVYTYPISTDDRIFEFYINGNRIHVFSSKDLGESTTDLVSVPEPLSLATYLSQLNVTYMYKFAGPKFTHDDRSKVIGDTINNVPLLFDKDRFSNNNNLYVNGFNADYSSFFNDGTPDGDRIEDTSLQDGDKPINYLRNLNKDSLTQPSNFSTITTGNVNRKGLTLTVDGKLRKMHWETADAVNARFTKASSAAVTAGNVGYMAMLFDLKNVTNDIGLYWDNDFNLNFGASGNACKVSLNGGLTSFDLEVGKTYFIEYFISPIEINTTNVNNGFVMMHTVVVNGDEDKGASFSAAPFGPARNTLFMVFPSYINLYGVYTNNQINTIIDVNPRLEAYTWLKGGSEINVDLEELTPNYIEATPDEYYNTRGLPEIFSGSAIGGAWVPAIAIAGFQRNTSNLTYTPAHNDIGSSCRNLLANTNNPFGQTVFDSNIRPAVYVNPISNKLGVGCDVTSNFGTFKASLPSGYTSPRYGISRFTTTIFALKNTTLDGVAPSMDSDNPANIVVCCDPKIVYESSSRKLKVYRGNTPFYEINLSNFIRKPVGYSTIVLSVSYSSSSQSIGGGGASSNTTHTISFYVNGKYDGYYTTINQNEIDSIMDGGAGALFKVDIPISTTQSLNSPIWYGTLISDGFVPSSDKIREVVYWAKAMFGNVIMNPEMRTFNAYTSNGGMFGISSPDFDGPANMPPAIIDVDFSDWDSICSEYTPHVTLEDYRQTTEIIAGINRYNVKIYPKLPTMVRGGPEEIGKKLTLPATYNERLNVAAVLPRERYIVDALYNMGEASDVIYDGDPPQPSDTVQAARYYIRRNKPTGYSEFKTYISSNKDENLRPNIYAHGNPYSLRTYGNTTTKFGCTMHLYKLNVNGTGGNAAYPHFVTGFPLSAEFTPDGLYVGGIKVKTASELPPLTIVDRKARIDIFQESVKVGDNLIRDTLYVNNTIVYGNNRQLPNGVDAFNPFITCFKIGNGARLEKYIGSHAPYLLPYDASESRYRNDYLKLKGNLQTALNL